MAELCAHFERVCYVSELLSRIDCIVAFEVEVGVGCEPVQVRWDLGGLLDRYRSGPPSSPPRGDRCQRNYDTAGQSNLTVREIYPPLSTTRGGTEPPGWATRTYLPYEGELSSVEGRSRAALSLGALGRRSWWRQHLVNYFTLHGAAGLMRAERNLGQRGPEVWSCGSKTNVPFSTRMADDGQAMEAHTAAITAGNSRWGRVCKGQPQTYHPR